jgi:hypothetical protein
MRSTPRLCARLAIVITLGVWGSQASAVDRCRAAQRRDDGTILVSARGVAGNLRWGDTLGQEVNALFNDAECVARGLARKCVLGAEGAPERTVPPDGCTIFFRDDGPATCAAYVRRCRPTPPPIPCPLFPADNIWNADISALPVHPLSDAYVASIGADTPLHPDFGAGLWEHSPIGIPYTVVPGIQPRVPVSLLYADESDPGPYPIPPFAPVEGGLKPGVGRGDRHVLVVEAGTCQLFEVYDARRHRRGAYWEGGSGAVWDLNSNALRPGGWTSADAAGLPILPGLARYDEVAGGAIAHALRFTAPRTQRAYVWPARHWASSSSDPNLPPMGIRARLKASVDISGFSAANQVILAALKRHGMLLADNGAPWFLSGTPDLRWNDAELSELKQLTGADFEIVDASSLMIDPDSGQAR